MNETLKIEVEISINGVKYRPRNGWTGKTRCSRCACKKLCSGKYKNELGYYCNFFPWGFEKVQDNDEQ